MTNDFDVTITVTGHEHSGKGNLIAFIAHALEAAGIDATVQLAETHNKSKLEKNDEDIVERLKKAKIFIMEQQV